MSLKAALVAGTVGWFGYVKHSCSLSSATVFYVTLAESHPIILPFPWPLHIRYSWRTSLAVGVTMAHVGEFGFVLLSASSQLNILPQQVRRSAVVVLLSPWTLYRCPVQIPCSVIILFSPHPSSGLSAPDRNHGPFIADHTPSDLGLQSPPRQGRERQQPGRGAAGGRPRADAAHGCTRG